MTKNKILIVPALLLAGAMLFSGCQSTPEREAVVVKGEAQIEQKAAEQQSAAPDYKYEAPSEYKSEQKTASGKLELKIDAEVSVPEGGYPVIKIQPEAISEQKAAEITAKLFPAGTAYETRSVNQPTKQDIEAAIVELKRGDSDLAEVDRAAYDEMIAEDIVALEEMYKSAPEQNSPIEFSGKYSSQPQASALDPYPYQLVYGDDVQTIDLSAKGLSGADARLIIEKDGDGRSAFEYVEIRGGDRIGDVGDSVVQPIAQAKNLPAISVEEAQKQAEELVKSLGIGEFEMAAVGAALEGSLPANNDEPQFEDMPKVYVFNFTQGEGMRANYVSNQLTEVDYASAWDYQALSVFVDDAGVCKVIYRSPYLVEEMVAEAVELLPFEEIAKRIEDNIKNHYEPADEQVIKVELNIDKISLGLGRVAQNEDFSHCLLLPVWDVYGTMKTTYVDEDGTNFELGNSYITINAMDGSVINREMGY